MKRSCPRKVTSSPRRSISLPQLSCQPEHQSDCFPADEFHQVCGPRAAPSCRVLWAGTVPGGHPALEGIGSRAGGSAGRTSALLLKAPSLSVSLCWQMNQSQAVSVMLRQCPRTVAKSLPCTFCPGNNRQDSEHERH